MIFLNSRCLQCCCESCVSCAWLPQGSSAEAASAQRSSNPAARVQRLRFKGTFQNEQVIEEGDEILVLAEDDDSYECNDGSIPSAEVGELPMVPKKVGIRRRFEAC